jgi:glutamyl-tRNA reductase
MHLLLVGVSHRTAPVDLRERLDFQARGVETALRTLVARGSAREAVVLSTCNRAELYAVCDDVRAAEADIAGFISDYHGIDPAALKPHVYNFADADTARHLFRVAAGLDSLVVGEPQILGQVKEAQDAAHTVKTSGPLLTRLFQSSFGVGKRVRTETGLGSGAVSVSFAAVSLARKIFGDLNGRNVLVVGAGEMGKLTARHMKSQGVHQVTIVSRTLSHAARTAEAIGGASAAPWEDMHSLLGAADIVITATGAAAPILTKAAIESVMRTRRSRPLFLIDIAIPRDIEPAAGEIEQVFLYNIDDLQATVHENLARRASEVQRAEAIVGEEVDKFTAWLRSRNAVPIVVALRQHFDAVRRAEVERRTAHLPDHVREQVDNITRLTMEKLLLTPTEQLKALGDSDAIVNVGETLTRIFGLGQSVPATSAASPADVCHSPVHPEDATGAPATLTEDEARRGDRRVTPFERRTGSREPGEARRTK